MIVTVNKNGNKKPPFPLSWAEIERTPGLYIPDCTNGYVLVTENYSGVYTTVFITAGGKLQTLSTEWPKTSKFRVANEISSLLITF